MVVPQCQGLRLPSVYPLDLLVFSLLASVVWSRSFEGDPMSFISVWLRSLQHRATARDQALSQVWAFVIGVPRERRLREAGG